MTEVARAPMMRAGQTREERRLPQYASEGVGELFQRDYVAVIEGSPLSPQQLVEPVRTDFPRLSPGPLASFSRPGCAAGPMTAGDTMHIFMPGGGHACVVLTHADDNHFTLRTQEGHFETGRITFGGSRDEIGRLVFRIRSRSSINGFVRYLMYRFGGMRMQQRIWVEFLRKVAAASGGRIVGEPVVSTEATRERPADRGEEEAPTFRPAKES